MMMKQRRTAALAACWALAVALLLTHNAWLWMVQKVTPDTDILALLPVQKRDPVLQQSFEHMVDAAQQRVMVLVGASSWSDAKRAATAYSTALATKPERFTRTTLNDQTQSDWLAVFQPHRVSLLTAQQEQQLRDQPSQFWVDAALRQLYNPFAGPKVGAWREDPFGLFSGWLQERAQETPVRPRDGFLFVAASERQYVLLPLTLTQPVFSMSVQQSVMNAMNQASAMAHQLVPDVEIISGGVILHAAAAGEQARSEVWTIGLGSLLGIIVLMWASFRSFKPMALILLSIAIGCLGALSICWMLFERIHLLTLVFGASLIGVAQDYGIYFLCHRLKAHPQLSSEDLLKRLLPALTLTLLAAVIGYMGLAFTPFPGLRNMAVFSALGLLFAWLTVICWFPLLLKNDSLVHGDWLRIYENTLTRWPRFQSNKIFLLTGVAMAVIVLAGIARLSVNDDIRLLQNSPPQLISDQIKLSQLLDAPTPVQFFLVRGATEQLVLEREEALKKRLDKLIAQQKIRGYQAMSNWVPSLSTQHLRRVLLEQKLLSQHDVLTQLAKQLDEDTDWVEQTRTHWLGSEQPFTVDAFLQSPASEPWRYLWLGKTHDANGEYASIVALRGLVNANSMLVQQAAQGIDGIQWVDKVAEISSVLGTYRQAMGWVLLCSYLVILGMLSVRYRRRSWRVVLPTALASLLTLALLGFIHQPLQLFHVLALMLLLGIGVDYGIFMQEQTDQPSTAWLAIGLSAANTLLSFGLLGLSDTPALRAFGITMLLGIALVWVITPVFRKIG